MSTTTTTTTTTTNPPVTNIIGNQNEQEQATMDHNESSTVSFEEIMLNSSTTTIATTASTSTPILPGQLLTENDHEDNLMELIDELIRNFLSRNNRRSPYRSLFRWTTFDDNEPNLSYRVVVKIDAPSPQ